MKFTLVIRLKLSKGKKKKRLTYLEISPDKKERVGRPGGREGKPT